VSYSIGVVRATSANPVFLHLLDPNRVVPGLYFFVKGEWHCWLIAGDKLCKMQMWPAEASYFGDKPERDTDQRFPLLEIIAQRTLFQGMLRRSFITANLAENALVFRGSRGL
jgi:hypothetical protein